MRDLVKIEAAVLRRLIALPAGLQRAIGKPPPACGDEPIDPTVAMLLAVQKRRGMAGLSAGTPERTRRKISRSTILTAGIPTTVGDVRSITVAGLPARHYAPPTGRSAPLLVFFHGGGFVGGDLDSHDEACRILTRHAGVHVLSVDYRLAPEHPFPAAIDDARAATVWALEHAGDLGADPARVAVGGDSAGANMSTVVCQLLRGEGRPMPVAQLLLYPPTDYHGEWESRAAFRDGLLLTAADIDFFHGHYAAGPDPHDFRHSPLRAKDLSGLPPAIVVTAALDPLRDEGEAYAAALREAGVPVIAWRVPGMVHAFINLTFVSRAARESTIEVAGALRGLLGVS